MAWTTPLTWVAQNFTAAIANAQLRDNMNETAPGIATGAAHLIVTDGVNSIAERIPGRNIISTAETTSSSTYADLATAGPALTITTGTEVLICLYSLVRHTATPTLSHMGVDITGATTRSPADGRSITYLGTDTTERSGQSAVWLETSLTAGSNTFTAKYKVDAGAGTTRFENRIMSIISF